MDEKTITINGRTFVETELLEAMTAMDAQGFVCSLERAHSWWRAFVFLDNGTWRAYSMDYPFAALAEAWERYQEASHA